MTFEFNHPFICTDIGAPEADRLVSLGLVERTSNTHPGQGTTNRRFFFRNAMLEFLWVCNPDETRSELTRSTHLWERWANRQSGVCPFGVCLRSIANDGESIAFPSWSVLRQIVHHQHCKRRSIPIGSSYMHEKDIGWSWGLMEKCGEIG